MTKMYHLMVVLIISLPVIFIAMGLLDFVVDQVKYQLRSYELKPKMFIKYFFLYSWERWCELYESVSKSIIHLLYRFVVYVDKTYRVNRS